MTDGDGGGRRVSPSPEFMRPRVRRCSVPGGRTDVAPLAGAREAAVNGSIDAVHEAVRSAAAGLNSERVAIDVAWTGERGDPVTVSLTYEVPVASPLAGWLLPETVTLRSSATMRREFA